MSDAKIKEVPPQPTVEVIPLINLFKYLINIFFLNYEK